MSVSLKGATWLGLFVCLSCITSIRCMEDEALLLDEKDFCTVPGAANVRACEWVVEQLLDQDPSLSYDFFCSNEEDCESQNVEGEVLDWYPGGCNGPKIRNKECGCCVFVPDAAPGIPTDLEATQVTSSSAMIMWTDGTEGRPMETYTVRCFSEEPDDCTSNDFVAEVTGIPRGIEEATVTGLDPETLYACFVLAVNSFEPDGICSDGLDLTTISLPDVRLTLILEVDDCAAFTQVAVIEAYCEAFVEEAGFPSETVCLSEESSCTEVGNDRRRLLNGQFEATIVLAGNFDGQDQEQIEMTANAVLGDETRLSNVQDAAVILLNDRGTEELAASLEGTNVAGGTTAVEDATPECITSEDCDGTPTRPVCVSNFCVGCGPIERPPVRGSCPEEDTLCQLDGSCLPTFPPTTLFEVDTLLDDCVGATFLDWCKLDERASGITRITSNVPAGGPDSALETTTTCDNADKASAFGVYAPVGLFNGITFEAFVETLDTLGFEFYKSRDGGCGTGNEESAPRLEVVVSGPVGGETSTTSFTLEPTFSLEFGNGPVTNDEWIQISSGPDDGSGLDNCNENVGGLGFYTTGYSSLFGFSGFFLDFRCSLTSWIQTLKDEGFDSFVEEGKIVGLTFSLGSFNAGVEGYVNGLNVKTTDFDWTWTFVANN